MSEALRDGGHAAIAVFGVGLAVLHLLRLRSMSDPFVMLVEVVVPLALAIALVASVGWLRHQGYDRRETARIIGWIGVGVVGMLAAMTWTIGHELFTGAGNGIQQLEFLVANNVTGGAVVGIVLGSYDVERKRRERAHETAQGRAERERDRFATLFDNVPNPTIHFEYEGGDPVIRAVNPSFTDEFGYTGPEAKGRTVDELIVPEALQGEAEELNDRLSGEDLQIEVTRRAKDGDREYLLYTVPLANRTGRGFATYVDISNQKRREQRLQVLNRVLRHDLRNAMNVIVGHANNLFTVSDDESVRECAEAIRDRSEELLARSQKARAVERVLDLDPTRRRTLDVASVLEGRVAVARDTYPGMEITATRPEGPVWAGANDLLGLAIDNLLENVVVHVENPSVHLTVEPGDPVCITVRDDGPGIPEPEIEVLNHGGETQLEHSSGLGLWLVTWIVRDADGDVTFRNTPDGAEVRIELPAADKPETDSPEVKPSAEGPSQAERSEAEDTGTETPDAE